MLKEYFPILLMLVMAVGFGVTMVFLSSIAGRKRPTAAKESAYECGSTPVGNARLRFGVKFYVISILFILFDVEAVLLWPWAVLQARQLKLAGCVEAGVFVGLLVLGWVYAWRKGALEWE